jgi:phenylacetate-CoA ligase
MASLRNILTRHAIMPLGDLLTGHRVCQFLAYYERSQYWDPELIAREEDRLLVETVRTAYARVPFYRELYDAHGVRVDQLQGIADLPRLPCVTKDMLRAAFPDRCTRPTGLRCADYTTSGSTGAPFAVRIDTDTISRARALMFLRAFYAGYVLGEPVLQAGTSPERGFLKDLKDRLLRVTYVSNYNLTPESLDRCLEIIESARVRHLAGQGQGLYAIARRALDVGYRTRLTGILTWGSILLPEYRRTLTKAFGCPVTDSYGIGEGIQVGAQCRDCGEDFHQFSLHVAVEFLRDGEPVMPGERGEIVLSRLDAGAMPLIRYRVGDVGSRSARLRCACGRTLPLIGPVEGRTSDIIVTPAGNQLVVHFFTSLFGKLRTVRNFQVREEKAGKLHILIEPTPDFRQEDWHWLRDQIQRRGDPALQLSMEIVSEIPAEASGKRRFIMSRLGFR